MFLGGGGARDDSGEPTHVVGAKLMLVFFAFRQIRAAAA